MPKPQKPKDIDTYISQFPADVQAILEKVRTTIRRAAPEAEETISYQMPAFRQHGILVYFAAWKNTSDCTRRSPVTRHWRKRSHGTLGRRAISSFPLDEPIPYDLIERIVKLRVKQDSAKAAAKRKRRR